MTQRSAWGAAADLWAALRPVLLPALGIAAIGALSLPAVLAVLAIAVIATLAWFVIIRMDWRAVLDAVKTAPIALSCVVAAALVTVLIAAAPGDKFVAIYEFAGEWLVWIGFLVWGLVFLARLAAFAVTPQRRALALVLAAGYIRLFLGAFVKGPFDLAPVDALFWPALLIVLLWWVGRGEERGEELAEPVERAMRLDRWAVSAAVLAALAFVVASLLSRIEPHVTSDSPVTVREVKETPGLVRPSLGGLLDRPRELARQFAPVLQFTADQRWAPIPVDGYLGKADLFELVERGGAQSLGRPLAAGRVEEADLLRTCPESRTKCRGVLTIGCPIEEIEASDCEQARDLAPGYRSGGTAYTRVVYDRDEQPAGAAELKPKQRRRVFAPIGPYGDRPEVLVQYWLFYYYDDWVAQTLFGNLRQSHEADWEVVTIAFDGRGPLFVALSSHCGTGWVPWEQARVADLDEAPDERFHTVVGVAEGSQANYYALRQNIPPNWARCKELLGGRELDLATYGYEVRDITGADTALRLDDIRFVDDTDAIMAFDGYWGWNSVMHFETEFGKRWELQRLGAAAETPTGQPLWYQTIPQIFCGKASERAGGGEEQIPYRCPRRSQPREGG